MRENNVGIRNNHTAFISKALVHVSDLFWYFFESKISDICELEPITLPGKWQNKPEVIRAANKIQREFAEVRQIAVEDIMEEEKAHGPPRVRNYFLMCNFG